MLIGNSNKHAFSFDNYQAPLLVQSHSPLEVVQQMFVKLGARYVVVVNSNGFCKWHSLDLCLLYLSFDQSKE
jgi:chloride channel 3/4/5